MYFAPNGPSLARLLDRMRLTSERLAIVAAAITVCDPAYDRHDRARTAAGAVANQIARATHRDPSPATG